MEIKAGDVFVRNGKRLRVGITYVGSETCYFEVIYCGPGVEFIFITNGERKCKSVGWASTMPLERLQRLYSPECHTILSIRNKCK